MRIDLGVAIMGCVERLDNINQIIMQLMNEGVPEDRIYLVLDTEKEGCAITNRRAWNARNVNQTHHLVLQDDVALSTDFYQGLHAIIKARPNHLINLFCYSDKIVDASGSWAKSRAYLWAQGILMSSELADDYEQWIVENVSPDYTANDDVIMALWCLYTKRDMWVTIPSLVEHLDDKYKSLLKHNGWGKVRKAKRFIGTQSPLDIDWLKGIDRPVKLYSYRIKDFENDNWRK